MRKHYSIICLMMVLIVVLSGCSSTTQNTQTNPVITTEASTETPIPIEISTTTPATAAEDVSASYLAGNTTGDVVNLTQTQRNSINMLNHLVVLTSEINASSSSRLYLEKAYSELYNNIYPNAVDSRTQTEINYLFKTIDSYRMIEEKRNRLEYIYEQEQAQAIRDAVPNPLALMNAVQSFSIAKLVTSVVYMAVDSYSSYKSSSAAADMNYLQSGWELDDEQTKTLNESVEGTFNYMIDTVRDYDLPGELALNQDSVNDYVKWKGNSNLPSAILFFEDNEKTYQSFGPYWLTLAELYYKTGNYQKCLSAIETYEEISTRIFRKDYLLSACLPYAIDAAANVLPENEYIIKAQYYADFICENTENDDWALRYFAAQTYIDLNRRTNDKTFLETAYRVVRGNVNNLLEGQLELNRTYLAAVEHSVEPDGATNAQKEDVKKYNELLDSKRKTELPPVSEPLKLNCDLLFSLADVLDIPESEKVNIDSILHENGAPLFLVDPIDQQYWFKTETTDCAQNQNVAFDGSTIAIPVYITSDMAKITVTIDQNGEITCFDNWKIDRVDRKGADISSFVAVYKCEEASKFSYAPGMKISINVEAEAGNSNTLTTYEFEAVAGKTWIVFDKTYFNMVNR